MMELRVSSETVSTSLLEHCGICERDAAVIQGYASEILRDGVERSDLSELIEVLGQVVNKEWAGQRGIRLPELLWRDEGLYGLLAFLELADGVVERNAGVGIPAEISWATLADLGRHIDIYFRRHGATGFDNWSWVVRHFSGQLFQLGRLQFERSLLPRMASASVDLERAAGPGGRVLDLHIPEAGPLTPASCDAAFVMARAFFSTTFVDETYEVVTCDSWLLDRQLSDYLPPESNIIQFQRRFKVLEEHNDPGNSIVKFIFHTDECDVTELHPSTTLERAIIEHIGTGRLWRNCLGWMPLSASGQPLDDSKSDEIRQN